MASVSNPSKCYFILGKQEPFLENRRRIPKEFRFLFSNKKLAHVFGMFACQFVGLRAHLCCLATSRTKIAGSEYLIRTKKGACLCDSIPV